MIEVTVDIFESEKCLRISAGNVNFVGNLNEVFDVFKKETIAERDATDKEHLWRRARRGECVQNLKNNGICSLTERLFHWGEHSKCDVMLS